MELGSLFHYAKRWFIDMKMLASLRLSLILLQDRLNAKSCLNRLYLVH